MATNFPTSIDTFTDPASTDALNAGIGHAAIHSNANDAIAALEAKVGVTGSAVTTSLDYKINHLASGGDGATYFPQAGVIGTASRYLATTTSGIAGGGPTPGGRYVGFVAPVAISVGRLIAYVTTAGTSMLSNVAALYTVDASGNLTQVAISAANTTWLGTLGRQSLAFVTPVTLVAGNAYVVAIYDNQSTGTVPQVAAVPALNSSAQYTGILQPFVQASNASVPAATITFGSLTSGAGLATPYLELSA